MEILYLNLNILNERCGGSDTTKKELSCISIAISSKKNCWIKLHVNKVKDINL